MVLSNSFPFVKTVGIRKLAVGVPLNGSQLVEDSGRPKIPRNSAAGFQTSAISNLAGRMPLTGGRPEIFRRFQCILTDTNALQETNAIALLPLRVALFSSQSVITSSPDMVLICLQPSAISHLADHVPLIRSHLIIAPSFPAVSRNAAAKLQTFAVKPLTNTVAPMGGKSVTVSS
jgi:hypothetical protein